MEEEQVIQKFPNRCPYCDEAISYDSYDLKPGENRIKCPSCKKVYFKIVSNSLDEPEKSLSSRRKAGRKSN